MELLLVAGLIALLRWAAGRFSAPDEAAEVPPPVPAPSVRRARRPRPPAAASVRETPGEGPAAVPPAPPAREPLPFVARPAPSASARDFATRDALRRAVIAREVLGPPLSLR